NATLPVALPEALLKAVMLFVGVPDSDSTRLRATVTGDDTVDALPLQTAPNAGVNRYTFLEFSPSPKKRSSAMETVLSAAGVYGAATSGFFAGAEKLAPSNVVVITPRSGTVGVLLSYAT